MANCDISITANDLKLRRASRKETVKCPFCGSKIKFGEYIEKCKKCDIIYHQHCWDENEGCGTYGCKEIITQFEFQNDNCLSPSVRTQEERHSNDISIIQLKGRLIKGIGCILIFIIFIFIILAVMN